MISSPIKNQSDKYCHLLIIGDEIDVKKRQSKLHRTALVLLRPAFSHSMYVFFLENRFQIDWVVQNK